MPRPGAIEYNDARTVKRAARIAAGECVECGEPATHGIVCSPHHDKRLNYQRAYVARHVAAGLCRFCSKDAVKGQTLCAYHRSENAARVKRCGDAELAAGHCRNNCGREAITGRQRCEPCWWRDLSYAHFGTRKQADAFKAMAVAQGYKCALTGRALRPGVNIAVDHIVPKARGGSLGIENCRLADNDVNFAKQDLLDAEFVALCREVIATAEAAAHALALRQLAAN